MENKTLIGVKSEEKKKSTRTVMVWSWIGMILTFILTLIMYFSPENQYTKEWFSPSSYKWSGSWFTTIDVIEKEFYEIPFLYVSIILLIVGIVYTLYYIKGVRCSLSVDGDLVVGVPTLGEQVTLPLKKIDSVSIDESKSSINIKTSKESYEFLWIENNEEIKKRIMKF